MAAPSGVPLADGELNRRGSTDELARAWTGGGMADAQGLGPCTRKGMRVRLSPGPGTSDIVDGADTQGLGPCARSGLWVRTHPAQSWTHI